MRWHAQEKSTNTRMYVKEVETLRLVFVLSPLVGSMLYQQCTENCFLGSKEVEKGTIFFSSL